MAYDVINELALFASSMVQGENLINANSTNYLRIIPLSSWTCDLLRSLHLPGRSLPLALTDEAFNAL